MLPKPETFFWTYATGYTIFDSFYMMLTTYNMFQKLVTENTEGWQVKSDKSRVISEKWTVKSDRSRVIGVD